MTDLSPAAQEVMDAYKVASDGCYVNGEWIQDHAGQIAAVLRAAALYSYCPVDRRVLATIADELENYQ